MPAQIKSKKRMEALRRIDSIESIDENIWLHDNICTICGASSPPYQLYCSLQCKGEDSTSVIPSNEESQSSGKSIDDYSTRLQYAWPPLKKMPLTSPTLDAFNKERIILARKSSEDTVSSSTCDSSSSSTSSDPLSDEDCSSPCTSLHTLQEHSKDDRPSDPSPTASYLPFNSSNPSSRNYLRRVPRSFNLVTELKTSSDPRASALRKVGRSPSYPEDSISKLSTIQFARRPSNTNLPSTACDVVLKTGGDKCKEIAQHRSCAVCLRHISRDTPKRASQSSVVLSKKPRSPLSEAAKIKQMYLSSMQSSTKAIFTADSEDEDLGPKVDTSLQYQSASDRPLESAPRGRSRIQGDRSSLHRSSSPHRGASRRGRSEE